MNRKELRIIFKNFFYGILTAAIVAGCWLSCYAQVKAGLDVTESLVEWVQEALLILTAGTFYLMARRDRSERGGLVLMGRFLPPCLSGRTIACLMSVRCRFGRRCWRCRCSFWLFGSAGAALRS